MRARTLAAGRPDALVPALGALATVVTAWLTVHMGVTVGAGLVLTVTFFLGAVLLFLFQPNVAVAAMIPIFATIPVLKLFVTPWVGPLKDAIALAAIVAAVLLILFERNRPRLDGPLLGLMGLFLALYVVMTFLRPGRTLRWAMASLIATALGIAFYGLVQQYLGQWRLVGLGYSFNAEVRTYNGHLRSFGTFDDSFAYAAFLFLGAVAVLFWMRQTVVALACLTLIAFGVAASYERTALLIAVGLIAMLLARFGWGTSAALVLAAAVAVAFAFLLGSSGSESRAYGTPNTVVTLNGRVAAWKSAFGSPLEWGVGQGVGKITAAPKDGSPPASSQCSCSMRRRAPRSRAFPQRFSGFPLLALRWRLRASAYGPSRLRAHGTVRLVGSGRCGARERPRRDRYPLPPSASPGRRPVDGEPFARPRPGARGGGGRVRGLHAALLAPVPDGAGSRCRPTRAAAHAPRGRGDRARAGARRRDQPCISRLRAVP